jgi:hypothetical protein
MNVGKNEMSLPSNLSGPLSSKAVKSEAINLYPRMIQPYHLDDDAPDPSNVLREQVKNFLTINPPRIITETNPYENDQLTESVKMDKIETFTMAFVKTFVKSSCKGLEGVSKETKGKLARYLLNIIENKTNGIETFEMGKRIESIVREEVDTIYSERIGTIKNSPL